MWYYLFMSFSIKKKSLFTEATFSRTSFILARSRRPGHPRLLQAPSQALVPSYGLSGGDGQIHDGPEAAWVLCPQEEPQLPPSRQGEAEHVQPPGAPGTHGSDVNERQRGSCPSVFVTARLCHLSLSAAAVGGESQEASAVLAVLAAVQGHEGDWWSRAVPRGARRRVESAGQVSPHSSDHDDAEREQKCFFCSWRNVFFPPSSSLLPPLPCFSYVSDYMVEEQRCRTQGRGIRSESQQSQQSQQSRSPDSACSLGYDSRESSPDRVPDGEVLRQRNTNWKQKI